MTVAMYNFTQVKSDKYRVVKVPHMLFAGCYVTMQYDSPLFYTFLIRTLVVVR